MVFRLQENVPRGLITLAGFKMSASFILKARWHVGLEENTDFQ
jgi:hypothetical protein